MSHKPVFVQKHTLGKQYGQRHFFISSSGIDLGMPYKTAGSRTNLVVVLFFREFEYYHYWQLTLCLRSMYYWEARIRDSRLSRVKLEDFRHVYESHYYDCRQYKEFKLLKKWYEVQKALRSSSFYKSIFRQYRNRLKSLFRKITVQSQKYTPCKKVSQPGHTNPVKPITHHTSLS